MPSKKIGELPPLVVRQLSRYLNTDGIGVKNWKDLIAHAPGNVYDGVYDVAAFRRAGQRLDCSPAEEVLTDFSTLGINVDELYVILHKMNALQCMETLSEHVSPEVIGTVGEERLQAQQRVARQQQPPPHVISYPPDSTAAPLSTSPDTHPEFGPLPPHPPPTAAQRAREQPPRSTVSMTTTSYDTTCDSRLSFPRSHDYTSTLSSSNGYESSSVWTSDSTTLPPLTPLTDRTRPTVQLAKKRTGNEANYNSSWVHSTTPLAGHVTPGTGYVTSSMDHVTPGTGYVTSSMDYVTPSSGHVSPNILHFSYAELSDLTEDFTADIVGMGAFGTVFRAKIRGNGPYAIKKLHNESEMGGSMFYDTIHRDTFAQELQLLTRYNHRNILSLVAYSNDGPMPCFVYEYMEHGSLAECLVGKKNVRLPWQLRLDIAKQVAEALHFLHTVNRPTCLVHGDVKSANILLDGYLVPKLSDFGLARELKRGPNERSTYSTKSDVVMGTMAYMAPEFIRNKKFTPRTDVYSFGVVLLEMYTGQPALSNDPTHKNRVLTERLARLIADSESHREEVLCVGDIRAKWPPQNAVELFDIATVCLVHIPKKRPGMDQVLTQLEAILPPVAGI